MIVIIEFDDVFDHAFLFCSWALKLVFIYHNQTVVYKLVLLILRYSTTTVLTWLNLWKNEAIIYLKHFLGENRYRILFILKYSEPNDVFFIENYSNSYNVIGMFSDIGIGSFQISFELFVKSTPLNLSYILLDPKHTYFCQFQIIIKNSEHLCS